MKTEIREWYIKNYPTDDLGAEIKNNLTFNDIFEALDTYKDIYETLGVTDSIIRERVFQRLSELIGVDYDYVYEQWLKSA